MKIKIKEHLKKIKGYIPGKPVEELKRELKLKKVSKLASNENPFYPKHIEKAVVRELANVSRYPESSCFYLRKQLAKKLKVKPENIVFGNGSDELIVLTYRGFTDSKSNVIVGAPTFLIYEIQGKISQVKVKRVSLKNYRYCLDDMAKAVDKNTKVIFIANPDNPNGTYCTAKEVEAFMRKIPENVIVFFDEAYFEFACDKDFPKTIKLLKRYKNIIISRTFSKAYGLAGLRVGYAVMDKALADVFNKVREPFNVNRVAQVAALEALKNDKFVKDVVNFTNKEKQFFYQSFEKLGLDFVKSATNFVLVKFNGDVDKLYKHMLKKGYIIRNMSSWGLKNCFRVTVGLSSENSGFIRELKKYLK